MNKLIFASLMLSLSGCAGVNFNADTDGAVYYEPVPYLFYSLTDKCISSVSVVALPGKKRHLDFSKGYGSSNLSAEFSNGLLSKVGQTTDTKIPETLTSIGGILTAGIASSCTPKAVLYPIEDGTPNLDEPLGINLGE